MELSSSWEADSLNNSGSQEIPRLLWNPKFHDRIHESPLCEALYNNS
jgi:hypothetical protein